MILQILFQKPNMKKMDQILKIKSIRWKKKSALTAVESKIPDLIGLATKSALTAVENRVPDVSGLVKKTDYNTKISDIEKKITDHSHDKYITTPEFKTLAADAFNARLAAQTDLIIKLEFDFKLKNISDRVIKNKTKHLLEENELKTLKAL